MVEASPLYLWIQQNGLKILVLNAENLFLPLDLYEGQDLSMLQEEDWQKLHSHMVPMKPLRKVRALAEYILGQSPDIVLLSEVGGLASLENFNSFFLEDRYRPLSLEGNSERGIDLGYLIHKNFPISTQVRSYRDRPLQLSSPAEHRRLLGPKNQPHPLPPLLFSRDVLALFIGDLGEGNPPQMIILGVHLKSKLDKERIDPQGRRRRRAELETLLHIYQELESQFQGQVPILIGGDFNGRAALPYPDPEFSAIYERTSLLDALEVAQRPLEERITYVHFHPSGFVEKNQLDYLFLPSSLHSLVVANETKVDFYAKLPFLPRTREEVWTLPSDHFPLSTTLKSPKALPGLCPSV